MSSLLIRLKERKLGQWGLAYLTGAWAFLEAIGFVADTFNWPGLFLQIITVLAIIGFFVTLVIAWYHGEKGRQRVSGAELVILALLFALGALGLSVLGEGGTEPKRAAPTVAEEEGEVEDLAGYLEALPGLAILPLKNNSALPEDQYFSDGFHDELQIRLQRTPGLRVVSRTSVEMYRDSDAPIPEIGRKLGVDYVLEGGVQRSGDRVRINLQLNDAGEDASLWGNIYDEVLTPENLFDVQSDVVRNVARELDFTLREEDLQRAARRTTGSPEAYDLFIRGREAWNRGEIREAADLFDRAVERDPNFTIGHAAAGEAHAFIYQTAERSRESAEAARRAALRAVELDPESEDAQLAMGFYLYRVRRDYAEALEWFARAAGSLRGDGRYHSARALVERRTGRWRDALTSFQASATLSPGWPIPRRELGMTLTYMRRYSEAEIRLQECLAVTTAPGSCDSALGWVAWLQGQVPEAWRELPGTHERWALLMLLGDYEGALALSEASGEIHAGISYWYPRDLLVGWAHEGLDDTVRAKEDFGRAASILEAQIAVNPEDERFHQALGLAYAGLGRRSDAVQEAEAATELLPVERDALAGPDHLFALAAVHARLGEDDEALAILERLLTIPSLYSAGNLRNHYLLAGLKSDPAFLDLLERVPGRVF